MRIAWANAEGWQSRGAFSRTFTATLPAFGLVTLCIHASQAAFCKGRLSGGRADCCDNDHYGQTMWQRTLRSAHTRTPIILALCGSARIPVCSPRPHDGSGAKKASFKMSSFPQGPEEIGALAIVALKDEALPRRDAAGPWGRSLTASSARADSASRS